MNIPETKKKDNVLLFEDDNKTQALKKLKKKNYAFQYYTAFNPKQKEIRREKQLIIAYTPASRYDSTIIIN